MLNKKYKKDIESRLNGQNIFAQSLAQSVRELQKSVRVLEEKAKCAYSALEQIREILKIKVDVHAFD